MLACKAALHELLERDAFYCQAFTPVIGEIILKRTGVDPRGISFVETFFRVPGPWGKETILCAVQGGESYGVVFGGACGDSENRESLIDKSSQEARSGVLFFYQSSHKSLSRDEFLKLNSRSNEAHVRLGWNLEFAKTFMEQFEQGTLLAPSVREVKVEYQIIPLEGTEFATAPVVLAHAASSDVQNLIFGPPTQSQINFERLSFFCHGQFMAKEMKDYLHPFP
jgi:hypothetical protein